MTPKSMLTDYYVSFGDLLINYYLHIRARNEDIVRTFMSKRSKLNCWCSVYTEVPQFGSPLNKSALELWYEDLEHV